MSAPTLLPGVPRDKVLARLKAAAGKEVESGKFGSEESSSALAVNTFGWFIDLPEMLPQLPGCPSYGEVAWVDVEYCARFPWRGGRHPWLEAAIETASYLIGVESKRFEPFRDRKHAVLSDAYDRPVWSDHLARFQDMRDALRANPTIFRTLDAAQLVKHAFGLVTDARRRGKRPHLHYLYAEPLVRGSRAIPAELRQVHRSELSQFGKAVAGAEVGFSACSYHEWMSTWRGEKLEQHATSLLEAFSP